jgi:hypothetical protein
MTSGRENAQRPYVCGRASEDFTPSPHGKRGFIIDIRENPRVHKIGTRIARYKMFPTSVPTLLKGGSAASLVSRRSTLSPLTQANIALSHTTVWIADERGLRSHLACRATLNGSPTSAAQKNSVNLGDLRERARARDAHSSASASSKKGVWWSLGESNP